MARYFRFLTPFYPAGGPSVADDVVETLLLEREKIYPHFLGSC